jgi:hypothetical protein
MVIQVGPTFSRVFLELLGVMVLAAAVVALSVALLGEGEMISPILAAGTTLAVVVFAIRRLAAAANRTVEIDISDIGDGLIRVEPGVGCEGRGLLATPAWEGEPRLLETIFTDSEKIRGRGVLGVLKMFVPGILGLFLFPPDPISMKIEMADGAEVRVALVPNDDACHKLAAALKDKLGVEVEVQSSMQRLIAEVRAEQES